MPVLTDKQISDSKTEKTMKIIAKRASYYRANPHRFCEEYLGLHLKLFQKILIFLMMVNDAFFYIASRGQGKTYLVALFCVCRAILYPGSKIVCTSYTFKQGKEIILKITDDFMQKSPLLKSEIDKYSTGQNDCFIMFKNGSWMRVYVASESSRGNKLLDRILYKRFRRIYNVKRSIKKFARMDTRRKTMGLRSL